MSLVPLVLVCCFFRTPGRPEQYGEVLKTVQEVKPEVTSTSGGVVRAPGVLLALSRVAGPWRSSGRAEIASTVQTGYGTSATSTHIGGGAQYQSPEQALCTQGSQTRSRSRRCRCCYWRCHLISRYSEGFRGQRCRPHPPAQVSTREPSA